MRLAAQAKGGYYPTPERVAEYVATHFVRQRGYWREPMTGRLLDPCCGGGHAMQIVGEKMKEVAAVQTYGIELHEKRSVEASRRLDYALKADLFQTSISNAAFSMLFLNPPYDHDADRKRTEHDFLLQTTRYLAPGGHLVFIIPRRRLGVSAHFLASRYYKIQCFQFPYPEIEAFDQVVLIAEKRKAVVRNDRLASRISSWAKFAPMEELRPLPKPARVLPVFKDDPIQFTQRKVDPDQAAKEARSKGLWADRSLSDVLWPKNDLRTRPLMPLRRGHIAMLVAAGFLDNLILEAEDERLIVKGRTTKKLVKVGSTEERTTYQERMTTTIIALDLATGTFTDIKA